LHTALDNALALLTFESDRIISYRIVPIKKGPNAVNLTVPWTIQGYQQIGRAHV